MELTAEDSGASLTAEVGDVVEVRLVANPGTGYEWVATIEPETDADSATEAAAVPVEGTPAMVLTEADRIYLDEADDEGTPGREVIRFRAESAGRATLVLEYRRPWEADVEPAQTISFDLTVTGQP